MNWQEIWDKIVNWFQGNWTNLIWFAVTLVVGIIVIFSFLFLLRRIMRRRGVDDIAIRFVVAVLRFVLFLLLILLLLHLLGVPISGLTMGLSAAILAIGMALRDFLSNIASGMILVGSKKYKAGDFIQIKSGSSVMVEGLVADINILFTTLKTYDSTRVTVPNNTLTSNPVINLGSYRMRRVAITLPVGYESDTQLVKKTLVDVMKSCGKVYLDPEPLCRLKNLGDSSLDFFLTCYCDTEDYWDVYFYIMDYGFDALKAAGINVPFPQITISQRGDTPSPIAYDHLPERVEKERAVERQKLTMEAIEEGGFNAVSKAMKEENRLWQEEQNRKKKAKAEEKARQKAEKETKKKKK